MLLLLLVLLPWWTTRCGWRHSRVLVLCVYVWLWLNACVCVVDCSSSAAPPSSSRSLSLSLFLFRSAFSAEIRGFASCYMYVVVCTLRVGFWALFTRARLRCCLDSSRKCTLHALLVHKSDTPKNHHTILALYIALNQHTHPQIQPTHTHTHSSKRVVVFCMCLCVCSKV